MERCLDPSIDVIEFRDVQRAWHKSFSEDDTALPGVSSPSAALIGDLFVCFLNGKAKAQAMRGFR
jgi:hypothetical protein